MKCCICIFATLPSGPKSHTVWYVCSNYIHIRSCLVFTTPPLPKKKNRSFAAQFVHHKSGSLQKLRSSPSIWRDFHWLQSRVTPTVGEAMLQKREDFHGWKIFPNGRSVIWSQKKFAELKFHRPTRHSLRVEKTQLLDVTVEGDIRKLISWIHDYTHVQIWNIHIRYLTICIHVQILNISTNIHMKHLPRAAN